MSPLWSMLYIKGIPPTEACREATSSTLLTAYNNTCTYKCMSIITVQTMSYECIYCKYGVHALTYSYIYSACASIIVQPRQTSVYKYATIKKIIHVNSAPTHVMYGSTFVNQTIILMLSLLDSCKIL